MCICVSNLRPARYALIKYSLRSLDLINSNFAWYAATPSVSFNSFSSAIGLSRISSNLFESVLVCSPISQDHCFLIFLPHFLMPSRCFTIEMHWGYSHFRFFRCIINRKIFLHFTKQLFDLTPIESWKIDRH